jgi:hypothetical protein
MHKRDNDYNNNNNNLAIMDLGHLLTRFGLTHPQISPMISSGSFCLLVCSIVIHRIHKNPPLLGAFAKLQKATISFVVSVCPSAWNNSASITRILIKFDVSVYLEKSVTKIQVSLKSYKNIGYFTWRSMYIYDNISLTSPVPLTMRNISEEIVQKIKTHILCSTKFFRASFRIWDDLE